MTKKEYNGWHNYETWLVKLWIDNEEGSYNYWREVAQECWNEAGIGRASFSSQQVTQPASAAWM